MKKWERISHIVKEAGLKLTYRRNIDMELTVTYTCSLSDLVNVSDQKD